jgi:hypothetical protein
MGLFKGWDKMLKAPKVPQPVLDPTKAGMNQGILDTSNKMLQGFRHYAETGETAGMPSYFQYRPVARGITSTSGGYSGYDPARMKLAYEAGTAGMDQARDAQVMKSRDFYAGRGLLRSTPGMKAEADIAAKYDTEKGRIRNQLELADITEGERQRQGDLEQLNDLDQKRYDALFRILNLANGAAGGDPYTLQSRAANEAGQQKKADWNDTWSNISKVAGLFF